MRFVLHLIRRLRPVLDQEDTLDTLDTRDTMGPWGHHWDTGLDTGHRDTWDTLYSCSQRCPPGTTVAIYQGDFRNFEDGACEANKKAHLYIYSTMKNTTICYLFEFVV